MEKNCPVCGAIATENIQIDPVSKFYTCPVCGRFQSFPVFAEIEDFNLNKLAPYLAHNGFRQTNSPIKELEYRYFTTMSKKHCDEYNKVNNNGHPVYLSRENVENWYPKSFSEKIDYILLYLDKYTDYLGEYHDFSQEELYSWLFIDRYDRDNRGAPYREPQKRDEQVSYMLSYLIEENYIQKRPNAVEGYRLTPKGYARVDELQKDTANGHQVLVAMKFGDETNLLREAIRKGITEAGYMAIFIDEVEHNEFITPELLSHIKNSKFLVADLSHQNNGVYFEEGFAIGLGKPVIQLCKKGVKLHFDIAQKNTIIWETEEEIPLRLKNRIMATIDD